MLSKSLLLESGTDIKISLQNLAQKEDRSGFVLGIVGNLSEACVQCPTKQGTSTYKGNLEIISLSGRISPSSVHLHLSFSDENCVVFGGHMEVGSVVLKEAELLIGFLDPKELSNLKVSASKVSHPKVTIAVIDDCPWCKRAIRMLRTLGIDYELLNINDDKKFKAVYEKSKSSTFPQVFINKKFIGGYKELSDMHQSGVLTSLK